MKKIFWALAAVFALAFTSCSSETPQEVAEAFAQALKNNDAEGIAKLEKGFDKASEEDQQEGISIIRDALADLDQSSITKDDAVFIEGMEVASIKEKGDVATVIFKSGDEEKTLKLTKEDGKWLMSHSDVISFVGTLFFRPFMPWNE